MDSPEQDVELKPCPFCGWSGNAVSGTDDIQVAYVECADCGAEGPTEITKERAIESWNHRHDRVQAEVAALKELLRKYGGHKEDCDLIAVERGEACTCGYDAALARGGV